MAAAQFWRAVGLRSYGDGQTLKISEFQLFTLGVRFDALATLTSNIPPDVGSLASLKDNDTSTWAQWNGNNLKNLVLMWDLGSTLTIDDIRIGSTDGNNLMACGLQYASSSSGPWTEFRTYNNIIHVAPWVLTTSNPTCCWDIWSTTRNTNSNSGLGRSFVPTNSTNTVVVGQSANGSAGCALTGVTPRKAGTGKWQFEVDITVNASTQQTQIGLMPVTQTSYVFSVGAGGTGYGPALSIAPTGASSSYYNYPVSTGVNYGQTFPSGSTYTIGVVWDSNANTFEILKNGNTFGLAPTVIAAVGDYYPAIGGINIPTTLVLRTYNLIFPASGATAWDATVTIAQSIYPTGLPVPTLGAANTLIKASGEVMNIVMPQPNMVIGMPQVMWIPTTYINGNSGNSGSAIYSPPPAVIGTPPQFGRIVGNYTTDNYFWPNKIVFGKIGGYVTVAGAPARRRVRIVRDIDGVCFGEKWSDAATGYVEFAELSNYWTYSGVADDYTGTYQSLIWKGVAPV